MLSKGTSSEIPLDQIVLWMYGSSGEYIINVNAIQSVPENIA